MKSTSAALVAFFNNGKQAMCFDLWTIVLQSGTVLRWTDADMDITTTDARKFVRGAGITRDRVRWMRGIQVDTLTASLLGPGVRVDGQLLPAFATLGGFDGSVWFLERAYFDSSLAFQGQLVWFAGVGTDVNPTDQGADITVKSQLTQLNQMVPRNLYQAGCLNNLFDQNCGVNRAGVTYTAAVQSPGGSTAFSVTGFSVPDQFFSLGILKFTSGANAGIGRSVLTQYGNSFTFSRPFPFAIAAGDAVTIVPGCDKTLATCTNKFANQLRFRGMPFVPVPETIT